MTPRQMRRKRNAEYNLNKMTEDNTNGEPANSSESDNTESEVSGE